MSKTSNDVSNLESLFFHSSAASFLKTSHDGNSRMAMQVSIMLFAEVDTGRHPSSMWTQQLRGRKWRLCPLTVPLSQPPLHPIKEYKPPPPPPGSSGLLIQEIPILRLSPGASPSAPPETPTLPMSADGQRSLVSGT